MSLQSFILVICFGNSPNNFDAQLPYNQSRHYSYCKHNYINELADNYINSQHDYLSTHKMRAYVYNTPNIPSEAGYCRSKLQPE